MIKIGVCQMQVGHNKAENLSRAEKMIQAAANQGAEMVILPEIFNSPYQMNLLPTYAEKEGEASTQFLARMARQCRVLLIGGTIPEKEGNHIYNSCFVYNRDGSKLARYRKMHLFDIDIPGQIYFQESDVLSPGNELTLIKTAHTTLAILICYDIRFPELARIAALKGAEILIVPAAFNTTTGPEHWELLMRARALDNQVFLIAAAPAYNPDSSYPCWGHSMLVDPWGQVLAGCGAEENLLISSIELDRIQQVRRQIPVMAQRRTKLYTQLMKNGPE
ncbi:MAG TPA: carbon-nitrogen hydrolase family protein [Syntrophomonadaceae bacterium]|nr:carbon-nitrogen hydrolase family protein [Syntrophomonadaceae bacterium]